MCLIYETDSFFFVWLASNRSCKNTNPTAFLFAIVRGNSGYKFHRVRDVRFGLNIHSNFIPPLQFRAINGPQHLRGFVSFLFPIPPQSYPILSTPSLTLQHELHSWLPICTVTIVLFIHYYIYPTLQLQCYSHLFLVSSLFQEGRIPSDSTVENVLCKLTKVSFTTNWTLVFFFLFFALMICFSCLAAQKKGRISASTISFLAPARFLFLSRSLSLSHFLNRDKTGNPCRLDSSINAFILGTRGASLRSLRLFEMLDQSYNTSFLIPELLYSQATSLSDFYFPFETQPTTFREREIAYSSSSCNEFFFFDVD